MCIFIASHAAYVEIKNSSGYLLPVLIEMIWYGWPNESISKWALVKESICMICVCVPGRLVIKSLQISRAIRSNKVGVRYIRFEIEMLVWIQMIVINFIATYKNAAYCRGDLEFIRQDYGNGDWTIWYQ